MKEYGMWAPIVGELAAHVAYLRIPPFFGPLPDMKCHGDLCYVSRTDSLWHVPRCYTLPHSNCTGHPAHLPANVLQSATSDDPFRQHSMTCSSTVNDPSRHG